MAPRRKSISDLFTAAFARHDGGPIPIPSGIVKSLIKELDGDVIRFDRRLPKGRNVPISSGVFADMLGTLERLNDRGRVPVLFKIMGRAFPTILDRSALAL